MTLFDVLEKYGIDPKETKFKYKEGISEEYGFSEDGIPGDLASHSLVVCVHTLPEGNARYHIVDGVDVDFVLGRVMFHATEWYEDDWDNPTYKLAAKR